MSLKKIFENINTDINIDIPPFIVEDFFTEEIGERYNKILEELNCSLQFSISRLRLEPYLNVELSTKLIDNETGEEVGHFTISNDQKTIPGPIFSNMTIHIGDEDEPHLQKYLGKGLARLLIGITLQIYFNIFKTNRYLVIDTDASSGFWENMGMINVEDTERYNPLDERFGYEKYITLQNTYNWAFKKSENHKPKINWGIPGFQQQIVKFQRNSKKKGGKKKRRKTKKRLRKRL